MQLVGALELTLPESRPLVVVVSHTHWDREWHQPFELFRLRLVDAVTALVELLERDERYRHFMLDGQTVALEDVLALRPELEPRLRAQVARGRLGIGPWWVLQDEFLVGGESIVRNLAEGLRVARRFGRPMAIGYLPDAFGHVAAMPRILAGFGIETAMLWRGAGSSAPGVEWRWRAPGGAEVLCVWLPSGYGNGAQLPPTIEAALPRLRAELARQQPLSRANVLVWMNGVDHAPAQPHIPALVAQLAAVAPDLDVVHDSLEHAVDAIRARISVEQLPIVDGELRRTGEAPVLPGVLSLRSWQKRAHDRVEALLVRQAEPLVALSGIDRRAALRHAWRLLLACQPHDSICGCSIDDVARDVDARLRHAAQLGGAVRDEALRSLARAPAPDDALCGALALANPHPFPSTALAHVEVERPRDDAPFRLVGPTGEVPFDVVSTWHSEVGTRPTRRLKLRMLARELPPLGVRVVRIEAGEPAPRSGEIVWAGGALDNGRVRVRAIPGGLAIEDLESGQRVEHTFEDEGDRGDAYNFDALDGDTLRRSREATFTATHEPGRVAEKLVLRGRWPLPRGLAADRARRERDTPLVVTLQATLIAGQRRVEIDLVLEHRQRDHRLRARFDLGAPVAVMRTDSAFGWIARAPGAPPAPPEAGELATATHPMSSLAMVSAPRAGVIVGAQGLHEVELTTDGALLVTVVRAVGWMSRSDLSSRRGHAGYQLPIPLAQGRRRLRFRYAIGFGARDASASSLARTIEPALLPPSAVALAEAAPSDQPLLSVEPPDVRLSSLKRGDDDVRIYVRLIGCDTRAMIATLRFYRDVRRAWISDLDERQGIPIHVVDARAIELPIAAAELVTLALEF